MGWSTLLVIEPEFRWVSLAVGCLYAVLSLLFFLVTAFVHRVWPIAVGLFVIGWIFQFVGHAFEGKPPEFFSDWRFLLVGTRWWAAKVRGKA